MSVRSMWLVGSLLVAAACGQEQQGDAADITDGDTADVSGSLTFGTVVEMTSANSMYTAADYHSTVKKSLPAGARARIVRSTPSNGFYVVNYRGTVGWATGSVMKVISTPTTAVAKGTARAASALGFSYHWGGESWDPASQSPGSCTGDCPDCSHSGSWGADCSGLITKAWLVGTGCSSLTQECTADRPTAAALSKTDPDGRWKRISRDSIKEGDVLASSGHVVYYVTGDAWGTPSVFECKGCADGCVYDARTFSSSYYTSRRTGW